MVCLNNQAGTTIFPLLSTAGSVTVQALSRAEAKLRIAVTLRAPITLLCNVKASHCQYASLCATHLQASVFSPFHSGFSRKSREKHLEASGESVL